MQAAYQRYEQSDAAKSALLNSVLRWKRVRNSGNRSPGGEIFAGKIWVGVNHAS